MSAKHDEIKAFHEFIVGSTITYGFDNEGYLIRRNRNERVEVGSGTEKYPIKVYSHEVTDPKAYLLNLFSESAKESPDRTFVYRVVEQTISAFTAHIVDSVLKNALMASGKNETEVQTLAFDDVEMMRLYSPFIGEVTPKMIEQWEEISNPIDQFMYITYKPTKRNGYLYCKLFDDVALKSCKVTKKNLAVLQNIFHAVLSNYGETRYEVTAEVLAIPKLEVYLKIMYQFYTAIESYSTFLPGTDDERDLTRMSVYLRKEKLEEYFGIARWMNHTPSTKDVVVSNIKQVEEKKPAAPKPWETLPGAQQPFGYGGYPPPPGYPPQGGYPPQHGYCPPNPGYGAYPPPPGYNPHGGYNPYAGQLPIKNHPLVGGGPVAHNVPMPPMNPMGVYNMGYVTNPIPPAYQNQGNPAYYGSYPSGNMRQSPPTRSGSMIVDSTGTCQASI